MARIEGVPASRAGLLARFAYWYSQRRFGKVAEPLTVTAHHRQIFQAYGAYEYMLDRARTIDARLKALVALKAAALIGCPF
ncbi:MAG: hypothetical protein ACHQ9S_16740 [Candidatus Binatia bacterium]